MARPTQAGRPGLDLLFNLALALVAELVVQVTGWSRLPVLLVVFAAGHLVHALTRGRAAGERAADRPAARSQRV